MSSGKEKSCAILADFMSPNDGRISKTAEALRLNNYIVTLLSFAGIDGPYPSLESTKLLEWSRAARIRHLPALGLAMLRGNLSLAPHIAKAAAKRAIMERELRSGGFDLVISTDPETLICAARSKSKGKFKLIYDAHEYYRDEVPNDPPRAKWVDKIHNLSAKHIDGFITINEDIAAEYSKSEKGFPEALVIQNCAYTQTKEQQGNLLRTVAKIPGNSKILLYQGGLSPNRGLDKLVKAFQHPLKGWHLVLMGSGSLETELRKLASDSVTFLPPAPFKDLNLWTQGADLGAVFYEPNCINQMLCSPNKLWEYPASRVPIIAHDLKFIGKKIRENGIGALLDPFCNSDDVRHLLMNLNDAKLKEYKNNCEAFCKKENWEIERKKLIEFCGKIIG